ncbi:MAG: mechanosensitive ion channel domain-containing protein [Fuerstiella sp.]
MKFELRITSMSTFVVLMLSAVSIAGAQPPEIRPGRADLAEERQQDSATQDKQTLANESTDVPVQAGETAVGISVSAQQIQQLTERLAADSTVADEVRQTIAGRIKVAADSLARVKKLEAQAATDQKLIAEASTKAETLRARLAEKPSQLEELVDPKTTLPDLVAKLAVLQPELQKARDKVRLWEGEATRRSERRSTISAELTSNPNSVAELEEQISATPSAEMSSLEVDARLLMLKAQLQQLNATVPAFKAELSKYEAERAGDIVNLQLQLAQRAEAKLQQQTERLSKSIAEKRRADARYVADQLLAFANGEVAMSPYQAGADLVVFRPLERALDLSFAKETAGFASRNVVVTGDLALTTDKVNEATVRLEEIRNLVAKMNNKIDRVGLTGAIGLELRKQLTTLLSTQTLTADGALRQAQMQEIDFKRMEQEEELQAVALRLAEIRSTVDRQPTDIELRLLVDRHESLKLLTTSYSDHFDRLVDLDITEKELIREVNSYQSFIREQVLWIRSHRVPSLEDFDELQDSLFQVARRKNWASVGQRLWQDMRSTVWVYAIFTVLVILLLGVQNRFRQSLSEIAKTASKSSCRSFLITVRAMVLTIVLAAAWPSLPAFLSWRLLQSDVSGVFTRAVGEGLLAFAAGYFTLNLLRHFCRPTGLGAVHFGWPAVCTNQLRRETYRLMCLLLPLLFSKAMLHSLNLKPAQVLERIVFIAGLLVMAWYQGRVLHPNRGIFASWLQQSGRWVYQLRWVAFSGIIGLPFSLAVMAAAGYYYTAYELSWRLNVTIWIVISLLVSRSFLMRLFLVQHRELRLEQARAKRQAAIDHAGVQADQIASPIVEDVVDLKEVSSQSKRLSDSILLITGLLLTAFVWADVHPALSVLDKWPVWDTTITQSVAYVDEDDGASKVRTDQIRVPVTVADCLISMAIIVLTITATRNLPGFLEITILQRLPIEPSVRYALRMVSQYFLVVIGTLMAFTNIGIGWDKVQWLAAALTVGLGFGLQEIFANFISGLIILFERPIRITDVVTIGDVSGSVSQIRMRATTITDWDLKEYIVPNKEFITGRLLNWTLSDKVNRVVVEVGVAYGTDTTLARKLLIEAATDLDEVLEEPGPLATFEQFGDSTLNLRLRCYLPNLENRLQTITNLHEKIDAKFKAAEIEISFPQLDLHVVDIPKS